MSGTAQSTMLGFVGYQEETSFAANSTAYNKVLQVRDAVLDFTTFSQEMMTRGGVFNRVNQGDFHVPGPFTAPTLSFTMDLYGHGSATNGTLTQTPLARLLGHCVGNATATQVGGNIDSAADADTITSAAATLAVGDICRVGILGDGRAEGQAGVSASAASAFDFLTAFPAAPTSADDIFAMQMIYPEDTTTNAHLTSDGSTSNNTLRFLMASGAQQYLMTGCACTSLEFSGFNTGEIPSVRPTFTGAFWADVDVTFPTTTASGDYAPAPTAGGSFFYQATGTTTRQTDVVRNFQFSVDHQIMPIMGNAGANSNQTIVGWVRGKSMPTITFDVEAQDATTTPTWSSYWNTDPNSITAKHILYTLNPQDGRAVALYLPKCRPAGNRPTQTDTDGLTYVSVTLEGVEGPTTTNALTRSAWRLGLG